MKKLLLTLLSVLMVFTLATTNVFAEGNPTQDTTTQDTELSYTLESSKYEWTVPANTTISTSASSIGNVAVLNANLVGTDKVQITVASENDFAVKKEDSTETIDYTLSLDNACETPLTNGAAVLVTAENTTQALYAKLSSKGTVAGTYKDKLTFTANIKTNPYAAKVATAQKLYDAGEGSLTASDIVQVNGVDCYVLQVDGNKAELITKNIYDVRFGGSTYEYHNSTLKTWMDNFYTNYLNSDPYILNSTVTSYYKDSNSDDLETYSTQTLEQHVFALDAKEAKTYHSKFGWTKVSGYENGFWVSAGYKDSNDSKTFVVDNTGKFSNNQIVTMTFFGARPAFWISLD